jgi:AraC-like DNA-binding protein
MNLLARVTDWRDRAHAANFHCRDLAHLCDVSPGYLNQFFVAQFYRPPQEWLEELRMWQAFRMLCEGLSIKECLYELGFKQISHFSRAFTQYHGFCPSRCEGYYRRWQRANLRALESKIPEDPNPRALLPFPPWIQAEFALALTSEERAILFARAIESQTTGTRALFDSPQQTLKNRSAKDIPFN